MANEENTKPSINIDLNLAEEVEPEPEVMEPYTLKGKEYLYDLAQKVIGGQVFTSLQVQEPSLIGSIFMPIVLSGKDDLNWMLENKIAMFYSDMADAGPRSINGYPMFFKMGFINADEMKIFLEMYKDIQNEHEEKKKNLDKYEY